MINLQVQEKLGPTLSHLAANLSGPERTRVSQAMGSEVRLALVAHFRQLGETRHTTADRLGGARTGFIAQLAENFDQASTVSVDEEGVSITMRHPVITRGLRDVSIVPKAAKFLALPMNGIAYGRRPREFAEVQFVHRGEEIRTDIAAFALVRSVTQRRDPTLLPSMDDLLTAAARGAGREIRAILQEAQRL